MAGGVDQVTLGARFWKVYERAIQGLAVVAAIIFSFATVLVLTEVTSRYFFRRPILGTVEITEYCLLWVTFLAAPWVQWRGANVRVEFLIDRLSSRGRGVLCGFTALLASATCAVLTYAGIETVWSHYAMGYALSTPLHPPSAPIICVIPLSTCALTIQFARETVANWRVAQGGA